MNGNLSWQPEGLSSRLSLSLRSEGDPEIEASQGRRAVFRGWVPPGQGSFRGEGRFSGVPSTVGSRLAFAY
jgi:hypothetical protein